MSTVASKENIRKLVKGELPLQIIHDMIRMPQKDEDRFWKYLEVLQEGVTWQDKILLRISDNLYVVAKADRQRVVKCTCGQEFGDYRTNWKLSALVYARRTDDEIREVYTTAVRPRAGYVEIREFYCPGCQAQLGVEVVPFGYPFVFEVLPDIDSVYSIEGKPLPDASKEWFENRTFSTTRRWVSEE